MPFGHAEGAWIPRLPVSKVQEFVRPSQTLPDAAASGVDARRLDVPGVCVGVTDTHLHPQEPMAT